MRTLITSALLVSTVFLGACAKKELPKTEIATPVVYTITNVCPHMGDNIELAKLGGFQFYKDADFAISGVQLWKKDMSHQTQYLPYAYTSESTIQLMFNEADVLFGVSYVLYFMGRTDFHKDTLYDIVVLFKELFGDPKKDDGSVYKFTHGPYSIEVTDSEGYISITFYDCRIR